MADIFTVNDIIQQIADNFADCVATTIGQNADDATQAIREQLWCGLSGDGKRISPNYDNDPYFDEKILPSGKKNFWYKRGKAYKEWKMRITPPSTSNFINLPPRAANIPNLFIDGTFYESITATVEGDTLRTEAHSAAAPDILDKFGPSVIALAPKSNAWFNQKRIRPALDDLLKSCGW